MKAEALEHWSQCLRCSICFSSLRDPHTLQCGHTFCRGCLKRLAQVAREDNPDVRRRHLRVACPACRHQMPAQAALRGRTAVNIAMKNMLELWERECRLLLSSGLVKVKSACTQTAHGRFVKERKGEHCQNTGQQKNKNEKGCSDEKKNSEGGLQKKHEETGGDHEEQEKQPLTESMKEVIRPPVDYFEVLMKRVGEFNEEMKEIELEQKKTKCRDISPPVDPAAAGGHEAGGHEPPAEGAQLSDHSSSSSETDASSTDGGATATVADADDSSSEASLSDLVGYLTLPRISIRREFTAVRVAFILLWCAFSAYVVAMGGIGTPYVAIATLFMVLLCLG